MGWILLATLKNKGGPVTELFDPGLHAMNAEGCYFSAALISGTT